MAEKHGQRTESDQELLEAGLHPEGTPQEDLLGNPVAADEEQSADPVYHEAAGIPESDNADADFETSREDAHAQRQRV
jgi:hypothetical protein